MPVRWTPELDARLLTVINKTHKLDSNAIASAWNAAYDGDDKLTASAVHQHLNKLLKKDKDATGSTVTRTPTKAAVTPSPASGKSASARKATLTPKTASGGAKRKLQNLDAEDDSESERAMLESAVDTPKRQKSIRRIKTPKTYAEPDSAEEEEIDGTLVDGDVVDSDAELKAFIEKARKDFSRTDHLAGLLNSNKSAVSRENGVVNGTTGSEGDDTDGTFDPTASLGL